MVSLMDHFGPLVFLPGNWFSDNISVSPDTPAKYFRLTGNVITADAEWFPGKTNLLFPYLFFRPPFLLVLFAYAVFAVVCLSASSSWLRIAMPLFRCCRIKSSAESASLSLMASMIARCSWMVTFGGRTKPSKDTN